MVDDDTNETILLVDKPAAGTWIVSLQNGSSPLKSASSAKGLDQPEVSASVNGTGATRSLNWNLKAVPGQVVRFVENAGDTSAVILETSEASGSFEFKPAVGVAGERTIVAEIVQDGLPRDSIQVATYEAPARLGLFVETQGDGQGTVTSDPAGISCGDVCEMEVGSQTITLTAVPQAGSRFISWAGECAGSQPTCTFMASTTSGVIATFEKLLPPKIKNFAPAKARPGSTLTINGTHLDRVRTVKIGSKSITVFSSVTDDQITVVIPDGTKTGFVSVISPEGTAKSKKKLVITKPARPPT